MLASGKLSNNGRLEPAALRQFLQSRLPEYMVPASFEWLDAFPLTPNGKIDRKALPAPGRPGAGMQKAAAPRSLTEASVAEAMREVLGIKELGLDDNFFELGGNSLLATQLIGRLRKAFQWELPLRLVFDFPSVEELARAISESSVTAGSKGAAQNINRPEVSATELPLSFGQERIWFLHQLEPGSHYNDHFDLRITGPVDASCLERAINEIVRRHQTLRSRFEERDGRPVLTIAPTETVPLPVIDLSGWRAAEQEREAVRLAVADCEKPFNLETGPLMRATLGRLSARDHLLCLTFDHIVIDGWSHGVFLSELTALYQAFVSGWPSSLPELPIQYADYAAWQQKYFGDVKQIEPLIKYWKKTLAGAPSLLEVPTARPRLSMPTFRGAREFFSVSEALSSGLSALGRRHGCTPYMVLLAAFSALLGRRAAKEDIVIGSPIANRNRADTEGLIGSFMNTLALRTDLRGDPTFTELLGRVRTVCLDAYAHQDLPFEKLVAELRPSRATSYSPVFQVMFILQNTAAPVAEAGDVKFRHFDIDAGSSKMDLTLNLEQRPDGGADAWSNMPPTYSTDGPFCSEWRILKPFSVILLSGQRFGYRNCRDLLPRSYPRRRIWVLNGMCCRGNQLPSRLLVGHRTPASSWS